MYATTAQEITVNPGNIKAKKQSAKSLLRQI
jgi:hypothetical protein